MNHNKEVREALEHNVAVIGALRVASAALNQVKDMGIYDEKLKHRRGIGGHAIIFQGKEYSKIQNSWRDDWGVQGIGNISQDLFEMWAVPGIPFLSTRRGRDPNCIKARDYVSGTMNNDDGERERRRDEEEEERKNMKGRRRFRCGFRGGVARGGSELSISQW
ncbi:hypothetical protein Vadar_019817 [Vaccinium darrowii]|uniref:Uncharacterized protein n=1 Tax=Vaccinium darrowii TaxID=229202 RepID=A0ACB7X213_9ERIC|nr:hypothetical protein Vadar_019817 [Vaccinium darrowii]